MTGSPDSTPYAALGVIFAVLALALVVYLWNLNRVLGYGKDREER